MTAHTVRILPNCLKMVLSLRMGARGQGGGGVGGGGEEEDLSEPQES